MVTQGHVLGTANFDPSFNARRTVDPRTDRPRKWPTDGPAPCRDAKTHLKTKLKDYLFDLVGLSEDFVPSFFLASEPPSALFLLLEPPSSVCFLLYLSTSNRCPDIECLKRQKDPDKDKFMNRGSNISQRSRAFSSGWGKSFIGVDLLFFETPTRRISSRERDVSPSKSKS